MAPCRRGGRRPATSGRGGDLRRPAGQPGGARPVGLAPAAPVRRRRRAGTHAAAPRVRGGSTVPRRGGRHRHPGGPTSMELTNEFRVDMPVDKAFEVLTDVERIAPCMPGAQLQEIEGEEYRGIVKVKVGP